MSDAVRYRATLAYDGSAYFGFQRQAEPTPTIQRALELAIRQVTGQQVTVTGAGRTDTGVHATGQVIAFDVVWKHADGDLLRALNAVLPEDIALQDIAQHPGFHPRFDARSRLYTYRVYEAPWRHPLWRTRSWHLTGPLDGAAMQQAAALLQGEHDFAAFGQPPQGENTVRVVYRSEWAVEAHEAARLWLYTIEATAFLQHMVRRIVGALALVGRGHLTVAQFAEVFARADLSVLKAIAPPQGLVLTHVKYSTGGSHLYSEI